jgi:glutathione synthase/RimK-type ligase-like ATP-grasp enzyme
MEKLNKQRIVVKIIKELSSELGFEAQFLSEDWIICLKHNSQTYYVYGYEWGLNSATTQLIAKDKTAAYEILSQNQINAIEHKLFFNYNLQAKYTGQNGCWEDIMQYVRKNKLGDDYKIVCKPNKGTGGNDVYKISTQRDLESTIQKMFSKYRDLCLCPFYNIDNEYRAITLNGEILLLYQKERPFVVGNGIDNLTTLIIDKYKEKGIGYLENLTKELEIVLPNNEKKLVSWKHNLGNGAKAIIIEEENIVKADISKLIKQTVDVLDVKFASIDIAVIQGEYYIMEINSGIMIENFAVQDADSKYNYYDITKNIYRKALKSLFKL